MTNEELIAKLQLRPKHMEVVIFNEDQDGDSTHRPITEEDVSVQSVPSMEGETAKVLLIGSPPEHDEEAEEEE